MILHRHLSHFLSLTEETQQSQAAADPKGLTTLVAHQDNIRAALAYAQDVDAPTLLRLATASEQLWLAGSLREGWRWLQAALVRAPEPCVERVRALNVAAAVATLLQKWDDARRLVAQSLALAPTLGDRTGEAWALLRLGFIELAGDNPAAAVPHLNNSQTMFEGLGDRLGQCRSLVILGTAMTVIPGGSRQGRARLELGLQLAHELRDAWGIGLGEIYLGFADLKEGDTTRAEQRFKLGLQAEAAGPIRAAGLEGLAELIATSDPRQAIILQAAAHALRNRDGAHPPGWRTRRSVTIRAQAEQHLDPDTAQEAWDEGFRMTTGDAIAYGRGATARGQGAITPPQPESRSPIGQ